MGEMYMTGYEAYCKAAAEVFGGKPEGYLEDMFGPTTQKRGRKWNLARPGGAGCGNRATVFIKGNSDSDYNKKHAQFLKDSKEKNRLAKEHCKITEKIINISKKIDELTKEIDRKTTEINGYISKGNIVPNRLQKSKSTKEASRNKNEAELAKANAALTACDNDLSKIREKIESTEKTYKRSEVHHAVGVCVFRVCGSKNPGQIVDIASVYSPEEFADAFESKILPIISVGFQVEGIDDRGKLQSFEDNMRDLLDDVRGLNRDSWVFSNQFRLFLSKLFVSLIEGPSARNSGVATPNPDICFADFYEFIQQDIALTRLFDDAALCVGSTQVYKQTDVILFGRSCSSDKFKEKFDFNTIGNKHYEEGVTTDFRVFGISDRLTMVSNLHAVLYCGIDGDWFFEDCSKHGSLIRSNMGHNGYVDKTSGPVKLEPGDLIYLGVPNGAIPDNKCAIIRFANYREF